MNKLPLILLALFFITYTSILAQEQVTDIENFGLTGSYPVKLDVYKGKVIFYAYESDKGGTVWVTDFTSTGTKRLFYFNDPMATKEELILPTSDQPESLIVRDKLFLIVKGLNFKSKVITYDLLSGIRSNFEIDAVTLIRNLEEVYCLEKTPENRGRLLQFKNEVFEEVIKFNEPIYSINRFKDNDKSLPFLSLSSELIAIKNGQIKEVGIRNFFNIDVFTWKEGKTIFVESNRLYLVEELRNGFNTKYLDLDVKNIQQAYLKGDILYLIDLEGQGSKNEKLVFKRVFLTTSVLEEAGDLEISENFWSFINSGSNMEVVDNRMYWLYSERSGILPSFLIKADFNKKEITSNTFEEEVENPTYRKFNILSHNRKLYFVQYSYEVNESKFTKLAVFDSVTEKFEEIDLFCHRGLDMIKGDMLLVGGNDKKDTDFEPYLVSLKSGETSLLKNINNGSKSTLSGRLLSDLYVFGSRSNPSSYLFYDLDDKGVLNDYEIENEPVYYHYQFFENDLNGGDWDYFYQYVKFGGDQGVFLDITNSPNPSESYFALEGNISNLNKQIVYTDSEICILNEKDSKHFIVKDNENNVVGEFDLKGEEYRYFSVYRSNNNLYIFLNQYLPDSRVYMINNLSDKEVIDQEGGEISYLRQKGGSLYYLKGGEFYTLSELHKTPQKLLSGNFRTIQVISDFLVVQSEKENYFIINQEVVKCPYSIDYFLNDGYFLSQNTIYRFSKESIAFEEVYTPGSQWNDRRFSNSRNLFFRNHSDSTSLLLVNDNSVLEFTLAGTFYNVLYANDALAYFGNWKELIKVDFSKKEAEKLMNIRSFLMDGDRAYISGFLKETGFEPYLLKLNSGELMLLGDVNKGIKSSFPTGFFKWDDWLYFFGFNDQEKSQLWRVKPNPENKDEEENFVLSTFSKDWDLKVFPNPTDEFLNFSSPEKLEIKTVAVFDSNGHKLLEVKDSSKFLDVTSLAAGTYILLIQTNQDEIVKKIIKR